MKFFLIIVLIFLNARPVFSAVALDFDKDGLSDAEEVSIYFTDPSRPDSDNDGFLDKEEIDNHFSPHQPQKTLSQADLDQDGLSDWLELQFGTNLNNPDTDADGYSDWLEINNSFDPLNPAPVKLRQKIIINTKQQTVTALLNNIPLNTFPASTGKAGFETPAGNYQIENKNKRAWSGTYGLWMPYWMGFIGTTYGIHELPEWPGGYKEGRDHLGVPVSHGCVRLGEGSASWLYNWAQIGTLVLVE